MLKTKLSPRRNVGLGLHRRISGMCHHGLFKALSGCLLVCVAVCVLSQFLYVRPRVHFWQNHSQFRGQNRFCHYQVYEKYEQVSLLFSKLFYTVSFTMVIKWSPSGDFACGGRSIWNSTCSSGVDSDLEECFFWGPCKPEQINVQAQLVQLLITSTDLRPQEILEKDSCL